MKFKKLKLLAKFATSALAVNAVGLGAQASAMENEPVNYDKCANYIEYYLMNEIKIDGCDAPLIIGIMTALAKGFELKYNYENEWGNKLYFNDIPDYLTTVPYTQQVVNAITKQDIIKNQILQDLADPNHKLFGSIPQNEINRNFNILNTIIGAEKERLNPGIKNGYTPVTI